MAPKKGNQHASKYEKLKNLDLLKEIYKSFCNHLADGFVIESWYFEHPKISLTSDTLEKYIEKYPDDFPPIQKEIAKKKGYQLWENVVHDSAKGINKDANTASLQMVMRNKYKWDKIESNSQKVDSEFDRFLKQLKEAGSWNS